SAEIWPTRSASSTPRCRSTASRSSRTPYASPTSTTDGAASGRSSTATATLPRLIRAFPAKHQITSRVKIDADRSDRTLDGTQVRFELRVGLVQLQVDHLHVNSTPKTRYR